MVLESDQTVWPHLQDYHSIDMPNAGRKRRVNSESQSDSSGVTSDTDKPKPKKRRLPGKQHIKSKPLSGVSNYDFVNYSTADLDSSSSEVTRSLTTTSTSCEITRHSSSTSGTEDMDAQKLSSPPICVNIINKFNP
jgi:hypothetical protein